MNELHTCIITQRVYLHCTLILHNLTLELYKWDTVQNERCVQVTLQTKRDAEYILEHQPPGRRF